MATPRLTMIGLYNTYPDIMDPLMLPEGVDRETTINTIIMECGELAVIYPNPEFMKHAVRNWSAKWHESFSRIHAAITAEYNALHNFDRHEDYTDTEATTGHVETDGSTSNSAEVESKISAYNEAVYSPDNKDTSSASGTDHSESDTTGSRNLTHGGHLYGNIGVTKSQEMLQDEIDLRSAENIYSIIATMFKAEFCIMVY